MGRSKEAADLAVRLGAVQGELRGVAVVALKAAGENVLKAAQDNAPKDTGALRDSGQVKVNPEDLYAAVSFTAPYAVRQHENLNTNHRTGGPKYLERAVAENETAVRELLAATLGRVFR